MGGVLYQCLVMCEYRTFLACNLLNLVWWVGYVLYPHKLMNKYKEKFVILQAIGIIQIKSKETRVVAHTRRYSSGPVIPNSATVLQTELHRD